MVFTDPLAHLQAGLARLDLLLHRQILRLRARYQLSLDEFRGLYISDQQVDNLIHQTTASEVSLPAVHEISARAEALRETNSKKLGDALPWSKLVTEFNLSQFEQDVLLLALAPEIDLRYETLYAYLNNDVTRKWPTCDLALRLFSDDPAERMSLRRYLLPEATLFTAGLLQRIQPTPEHPSWLASGFTLASPVSHYILGLPFLDPRLTAFVEHSMPSPGWDKLPLSENLRSALARASAIFKQCSLHRRLPILVLEGRYGSGRRLAAEAVCRALEISILQVDLEAARASSEPPQKIVQALVLQQRLQRAGVSLVHAEALFDKEGNPLPDGYMVVKMLPQFKGPVFFCFPPGTRWRELLKGQRLLAYHFGDLDFRERLDVWEKHVSPKCNGISQATLQALADRFVLTPGQIQDAVSAAIDAWNVKGRMIEPLAGEALFEAARAQSDQSLGNLAAKVATIHTWNDLVLPPATLRRVKEVTAAIKDRYVVYSEWGFEDRIGSGKGLKVLFSGASGTGKTMTAGVIARDLGLDLYKIDLAGVVSKYIGETEKNLDRIFRAAQCSNAILFFDEADALFGKRSEVRDAHDRYANIEVAYLLQKIEEHEGIVILASNLSKNIDQAFSRRMHYVVEFPLPDETHREKLWRGMFPSQVPLGTDVDFRFLAKQFPISGGDIRNVALDAAFLAVQDGRKVTMKQLIKAMAQQMMKQGKVPSPSDFKQYHPLIAQTA